MRKRQAKKNMKKQYCKIYPKNTYKIAMRESRLAVWQIKQFALALKRASLSIKKIEQAYKMVFALNKEVSSED